jgi:hypothetical protein
MRNKAKLGRAGVSGGRRGASLSCKTKPIPVKGMRAKQTQFTGAGGRLCKTNPISYVARASCPWIRIMGARAHATIPAGEIPHRSTVLSFHHSNPMPIVRNQPNPAKQTQFPVVGQDPSSGLCKTKPILPADVQNEPNLFAGTWWDGPQGHGTRGKCAKRTQFLDCGLQIAQNEPNSPAGAQWDGVWGTRIVEGNCAKRSQFAPHRWNEAAGTRAGRTVPGRIDNWR